MIDPQLQPLTPGEKAELLALSRDQLISAAKMVALEWSEEEKQNGRKMFERGPQERDLWLAVQAYNMVEASPI